MAFIKRWYQKEAVSKLIEYLNFNKGNPIVAMPTGTGKSLVIADFITQAISMYPFLRIMMLTHDATLVEQNANALKREWEVCPLGFYAASLNMRDRVSPIIYGTIQSVYKAVERKECFSKIDLIIIDECHLVSNAESSQYQQIIKHFKTITRNLRVIGFSATPYRMKNGLLTEGDVFDDFAYDITNFENFNRLIKDGFLAPLVSIKTKTEINEQNVQIVGGEYNLKQSANETEKILYDSLCECTRMAYDRNAWLIFVPSIELVDKASLMLSSMGVECRGVHSKQGKKLNNAILKDYKKGNLQAVVNNNKLTTGFDHPPIDFIGLIQLTRSVPKFVQMLGRGTRPSIETGKENCLVGDFAGNSKRLGPINDPVIPKSRKSKPGDMPIKVCSNCNGYNHPSARICELCGKEFKFRPTFTSKASEEAPMRFAEEPLIEEFNVNNVFYSQHNKSNSPPSIKVIYACGNRNFTEWVFPEHSRWSRKQAESWWLERINIKLPPTVFEALKIISKLNKPKSIRVQTNLKYPKVLAAKW